MNENIQNQHSKPTQPTSSLKCLLVFVASLIGSPFMLSAIGRWPTNIPGVLGALLGTTISLFAVAMLVSFLIRGWPGVGVGIIVVIIEINLAASGQHLTRKEPREQSAPVATNGTAERREPTPTPTAEMIPLSADQIASAPLVEPRPTPSATPEVTKPALVITKMEYSIENNSFQFTVTNQSERIVTKCIFRPVFLRPSDNCKRLLSEYTASLTQGTSTANDFVAANKELIATLGIFEKEGALNTFNRYPNGMCLPHTPPDELNLNGFITVGGAGIVQEWCNSVNIPPNTSQTFSFALRYKCPPEPLPLFYIEIKDIQTISNQ